MLKSLFLLLSDLLGTGFARVLTGAGLSMVSFAAITVAVTAGLSLAVSHVQGLTGDVAQIVRLLGVGEALSIIGSALLTRAAMSSAGIGFKKASS